MLTTRLGTEKCLYLGLFNSPYIATRFGAPDWCSFGHHRHWFCLYPDPLTSSNDTGRQVKQLVKIYLDSFTWTCLKEHALGTDKWPCLGRCENSCMWKYVWSIAYSCLFVRCIRVPTYTWNWEWVHFLVLRKDMCVFFTTGLGTDKWMYLGVFNDFKCCRVQCTECIYSWVCACASFFLHLNMEMLFQ